MNRNVRDFVLRTQGKIIDHYRQVLPDPGIPELERQSIRNRLLRAEAELESLSREENGFFVAAAA